MLNPKSKRSPLAGRARLVENDAATEDSIWSGLHSVSPPLGEAVADPPRVRLLRTTDPKPSAPRWQDFFPRETRPFDRVITFWDPSGIWPKNALADLAGEGVGAVRATRLAHVDSDQTFALVHHVSIDTGGRLHALLHVQATPVEAASADVALMLLERSDHAFVLTGNAAEYRELPRRLQEFCRQAAWRGPALHFLSPQDKPSRSDRLRKVSWPRSLGVQVVETPSDAAPGWLTRLLGRLLREAPVRATPDEGTAAPGSARSLEGLALPSPFDDDERAALPPRPAPAACEAALRTAALAPGVQALAVLDVSDHATLARHGEASLVDVGVRTALKLWADSPPPADQWHWHNGRHHHLAVAVPGHPALLLVGVIDRDAGEPREARWLFAVALNELTSRPRA